MKIKIYHNDKLQKVTELLASFYLTFGLPDNRLKKPVIKRKSGAKPVITMVDSPEYKNWKMVQSQSLISQGFSPEHNAQNLYSGSVVFVIKYHAKQNKDGSPCKVRPDISNLGKGIHDLIQWTKQKGYGFFIQDDKQIMSSIVVNDKSVPDGMVDCEIWKLKDKE